MFCMSESDLESLDDLEHALYRDRHLGVENVVPRLKDVGLRMRRRKDTLVFVEMKTGSRWRAFVGGERSFL